MKQARRARLKTDAKKSWYRFLSFEKRGAPAAFSTRRFHTQFAAGVPNSVVIAHRKHFCRLAGVPFDSLVCLEQVHSSNIFRVRAEDRGRGARKPEEAIRGTDAALTDSRDVVLSVRTADCAPVFFLDRKRRAIGIAHIGWRGASERLASKVVQAFRRQFLSKPEDLAVAIGPMIRSCCYEVGDEFKNVFGSFVTKRKGRFYFDLTRWILDDLAIEGIRERRIYDCGFCTHCLKDQFPSYRRDKEKTGYILSVIKLN